MNEPRELIERAVMSVIRDAAWLVTGPETNLEVHWAVNGPVHGEMGVGDLVHIAVVIEITDQ